MADRDIPPLPQRLKTAGPDPTERETSPIHTTPEEILAQAGVSRESYELAKQIAMPRDAVAYLHRSAGETPRSRVCDDDVL